MLHHTTVGFQICDIKAWFHCFESPSIKESSCKPRDFALTHDVRVAEMWMSSSNEFFAIDVDVNKDGNGLSVKQLKA